MLHKVLGVSYAQLNRTEEAYASLSRGVDLFDPTTPYDDLFHLGRLAFLNGDVEEARRIFELARFKLPAGDERRRRQLDQAQSMFDQR